MYVYEHITVNTARSLRYPTNQEAFSVIDLLAGSFDNSSFKLNGKSLFPLLRLFFIFFLKNGNIQFESKRLDLISSTSISRKIDAHDEYWTAKELGSLSEKQTKESRIILFIRDGVGCYTNPVTGITFDRYFDPIITQLPSGYSYKKLCLQTESQFKAQNLNLFYDECAYRLEGNLQNQFNLPLRCESGPVSDANALLTFLQSSHLLSPDIINAAIKNRFLSFFYFYDAFVRYKPRVVFVRCYYSPTNVGACLAAKVLGIPLIDVQHGPVRGWHSAYNHWPSISLAESYFLPTAFWLWDDVSRDYLVESNDLSFRVQSIVVGDPWDSFISENSVSVESEIISNKAIILLCLGYAHCTFPDHIFLLMKQASSEAKFLVRRHPADDTNYFESFLLKMDETGGIDYDAKMASSAPLPILLRQSHCVLCHPDSGVVEEANRFNVPVFHISDAARAAPEDHTCRAPHFIGEHSSILDVLKKVRKDVAQPSSSDLTCQALHSVKAHLCEMLGEPMY